jgi:hypothetical protein
MTDFLGYGVVTATWKLAYYPRHDQGFLFHRLTDPSDRRNLWPGEALPTAAVDAGAVADAVTDASADASADLGWVDILVGAGVEPPIAPGSPRPPLPRRSTPARGLERPPLPAAAAEVAETMLVALLRWRARLPTAAMAGARRKADRLVARSGAGNSTRADPPAGLVRAGRAPGSGVVAPPLSALAGMASGCAVDADLMRDLSGL